MVIEHIDLDKSKPNKDFGKGFYLSESEMQAMEMATAALTKPSFWIGWNIWKELPFSISLEQRMLLNILQNYEGLWF